MTVTTLDPKTALIVIDLQKGFLALPTVHPVKDIVRQAARLAAAFRQCDLPVVLVNVDGRPPGRTSRSFDLGDMPPDWADLVPELDRQARDHGVTKRTAGAFTSTGLDGHLRAQGITQVIVCGVSTSMGVESTARHAYELGYNVTLAIDAMTDLNAEAHANSLERIFPRIAELGTTDEILALIDRDGR